MIYVCVPVHNEAKTAGLVLWKVRQVFSAFPREYQLLVLDDASTDGTAELLASYAKVLPMTTITHRQRQGYARSLEELLRLALQRTDRPKRDCAITLHADFVHSPEAMEEMVKRLESGADLVVAELLEDRGGSRALRLARRWAPRLLRLPGLHDTISGFVAPPPSPPPLCSRPTAGAPTRSCSRASSRTRGAWTRSPGPRATTWCSGPPACARSTSCSRPGAPGR